jgi:hypothetical protein
MKTPAEKPGLNSIPGPLVHRKKPPSVMAGARVRTPGGQGDGGRSPQTRTMPLAGLGSDQDIVMSGDTGDHQPRKKAPAIRVRGLAAACSWGRGGDGSGRGF